LVGEERFAAGELFSSTYFVFAHCFVIPNLAGEVGIRDGDLRGNMGNNISVMNDSKSLVDLFGEECSESLVANSGLPK
jgi:hypothetical protein